MATTPTYDPALWYSVKVNRYVPDVRGQSFRPKDDYTLKGDVVAELGDAVATAIPADHMNRLTK
jgi:hypothetical protein